MEKLVVILDDVAEYGTRLALYLNSSRTFPYRAVVFSNAVEAEGHIKSGGVYAVLVSERLEKEVLSSVVGTETKVFWISETKELLRPYTVYRYGLAREIERILTEKKEETHVPVIGFFSPGGGCEAEELSRKIAEAFGKNGKSLYISAFPFGIFGRAGTDGLSEALYFLRQSGEASYVQLESVIQHGEYMDCIGPVRWYTDLESVKKEDLEKLLQRVSFETEYGVVFVAVGQFDRAGKRMLECCDRVLVPVWETEAGRKITEEFRHQLKESGESGIYAALVEFSVRDASAEAMEEAVKEAVRKGGEAVAGSQRGDS